MHFYQIFGWISSVDKSASILEIHPASSHEFLAQSFAEMFTECLYLKPSFPQT
ncbi:hypothetical protein N825_04695 [Skermanella stibiiresistens SB22]|uniref:Uncharacterized protein n=1 Tax=Skermanella stibiiresistens SB22 TaxID=1385369 RepID=W9H5D4_9PROT|nr:hypothetical protein N825_04695 [Skermanella stibiiresistens SB22]